MKARKKRPKETRKKERLKKEIKKERKTKERKKERQNKTKSDKRSTEKEKKEKRKERKKRSAKLTFLKQYVEVAQRLKPEHFPTEENGLSLLLCCTCYIDVVDVDKDIKFVFQDVHSDTMTDRRTDGRTDIHLAKCNLMCVGTCFLKGLCANSTKN